MFLTKNVKTIYFLITFTTIAILYVIFRTQTTLHSSQFKVLNTSDIIQHLNQKHNVRNNKSAVLGLNLKYKLSPAPCDIKTKLIILVTSHFHNVEARSAMRRTFNTTNLHALSVKRVFLLGTVTSDKSTSQASIENESIRFQDILQGNFVEAYRNLTYKHIMGLKWATDHCYNANYVIKMDDDIVIDLRRIIKDLNKRVLLENKKNFTLLAGYALENMVPKRDPANKWFVTHEEYPEDTYPTFLSGWFYITNPTTAKLLILASKMHQYFWIDDTLITGIFAKFLEIKHVNLAKFYTLHTEFVWCCIDDYVNHHLECPFFVGPNGGDANLFIEFNKAVGHCSVEKCIPREKSINETCIRTARTQLGPGKSQSIETYKLF